MDCRYCRFYDFEDGCLIDRSDCPFKEEDDFDEEVGNGESMRTGLKGGQMTLIIFKPTGEVRQAKKGEWLRYNMSGDYSQWISDEPTGSEYPIFTRHEIDVTPEVFRVLGMEEE